MSQEISTSELTNAWENRHISPGNELVRPTQNIPPTNIVPYSRFNTQNYPQYGIVNEQQIQPKYQSWSPQATQTNINTAKGTSADKSATNCITSKLVIGLLIGVIVCGVPMIVMSVLYAQAKSSSNNSTSSAGSSGNGSGSGSGTSSTNTSSLPSQCTSNTALSDNYRYYTYTGCCYTADCSLTAGWYRIQGAAGSQLVTTPMSTGYCGQNYPAWFNSSFPSTAGATVIGGICVNVGGTVCPSSYSTTVSVTNCNGYYVFYLVPFSSCTVRYCTI